MTAAAPVTPIPDVRRSSRSNRGVPAASPGFNCLAYEEEALIAIRVSEPSTYRAAVQSSHGNLWQQAMDKEFDSLMKCNTWELTPLPRGRKAIGCKWVYKLKYLSTGEVERFKARLCAKGFSQVEGIDYDETFAPVAKFTSIRVVLAIAAVLDLDLTQMDVDTAFLYGLLEDEIYMKQPEGYVVSGKEEFVCKLKRGLYGLKQSPRIWNGTLDKFLQEQGFVPCTVDPCIYVHQAEGWTLIVVVYVDDLIIADNNKELKAAFVRELKNRFSMKDLG